MQKIKLYKPIINKEEINSILKVAKRGILSRGIETIKFEEEFAKLVNKKYAIAVSSGTAGLHLAIRATGWNENDEIITTPFSFIASTNALLYEKIKPVFVDIDDDCNINPDLIENKINKNTKGILLVHVFGLPANYKKIKKIINKYKLEVIEDACEALFPYDKDFNVGKLGKATVYGFYENKQITTGGEGGIIVTNDKKIADKCRSMRDHGKINKKNWISNINLGFNYRITEIQAAFGRSQIKKIKFILKERRKIALKYHNEFKELDDLLIPDINIKRSWFIYFITFKNNLITKKVIKSLNKQNIDSKIYFPSIHLFAHVKKIGYKNGDFPKSEFYSKNTLALPFYLGITDNQIKIIARIVKKSL